MTTETRDGTAWIRLNRPEVLNSFDEEMGNRLLQALEQAKNPGTRCVIVTGHGKAFCAGEDLRALASVYQSGVAPDLGDILRRRYNPAIEAILSLDKPVIAAINGVAAGAGVSLALACDLRLMAEDATLVLGFSRVGLIPDAGGTWLLPKYLGVGRALEMAFLSDPLDSAKAQELGLVNRVVARDDLAKAAEDLARRLAGGPTKSFGLTKHLIWRAAGGYLSKHLEAEADAQTAAGKAADHLEGVKAFGEKRPPKFDGR